MRAACVLTIACLAHACSTTRAAAPIVTPDLLASARAQGFDELGIARGRELYVAQCARCHASPRASEFTRSAWEELLPRMSRRSGFDDAEAADVRSFVLAARGAARD